MFAEASEDFRCMRWLLTVSMFQQISTVPTQNDSYKICADLRQMITCYVTKKSICSFSSMFICCHEKTAYLIVCQGMIKGAFSFHIIIVFFKSYELSLKSGNGEYADDLTQQLQTLNTYFDAHT